MLQHQRLEHQHDIKRFSSSRTFARLLAVALQCARNDSQSISLISAVSGSRHEFAVAIVQIKKLGCIARLCDIDHSRRHSIKILNF